MRRTGLLILLGISLGLVGPAGADIAPPGTVDTTTLGDWLGVYGSEGYILAAFDGVGSDRVSLPGYISSYSLTDVSMWVWNGSSSNPEGLLDPAGGGNRVEATWYRPSPYIWSVTLTPAETLQFCLGLYMLDPEGARTQTITFSGAGLTGTDTIANIHPGKWVVYDVSATAGQDITVTFDQVGGPNAVLSAMAFDPIPEPMTLLLLGVGGLGLVARRRGK